MKLLQELQLHLWSRTNNSNQFNSTLFVQHLLQYKLSRCFSEIQSMTPKQILLTINNIIKSYLNKQWQVKEKIYIPQARVKTFNSNSGKEKLPLKREETSSRIWIIRGDVPAEDQQGQERKEKRGRTERDNIDSAYNKQQSRTKIQIFICIFIHQPVIDSAGGKKYFLQEDEKLLQLLKSPLISNTSQPCHNI